MTSDDLTGTTTRECEWCGDEFVPSRSDQAYCKTSHRVRAYQVRKEQAETHEWLVTTGGREFTDRGREERAESLVELHERTTRFATQSYTRPEADRTGRPPGQSRVETAPRPAPPRRWPAEPDPDDADDEVDLDDDYADPGDHDDEAGQQAWNDQLLLDQKLDQLWDDSMRKAKPWFDLLERNPGRIPPELAEMQREYEQEFRRLVREHENARGRQRAEREAPYRVARAQKQRRGQQAMQGLAADLGRSRRGDYAPQSTVGQDWRSRWAW